MHASAHLGALAGWQHTAECNLPGYTHKAHRDPSNTGRHVLYLFCQDVSTLNMHTHTESLCCSFTAPTQLQFAVRQDSQGWSKKCQHILHLTFLLLTSPLRLLAFILDWEFRTRQSYSTIFQQQRNNNTAGLLPVKQSGAVWILFLLPTCKCLNVAGDLQ